MRIVSASGKPTLSISRGDWQAIGKKAGWTVTAARKVPVFSSEATLRRVDIEEDPRSRLPEIAEDIVYDAESDIPSMMHPDPGMREIYSAEVTAVGEPRIEVRTESDDQGEYSSYDIEIDVRITVFAKVPTTQDIKGRLSREWLEFKE